MTPAELAATCERILRPALAVLVDQEADPEAVADARNVLRRVTDLIDALHGFTVSTPDTPRSRQAPGPLDARARARGAGPGPGEARAAGNADRAAEGLHGLRKGRRQCEATTRTGARCKAPAAPGAAVCRRHGGAAPQVRVAAAMTALYEVRYKAGEAWQAARGTSGEFDALCALTRAQRAVERGEAKMARVRELRRELRRRNAGVEAGPVTGADPAAPI